MANVRTATTSALFGTEVSKKLDVRDFIFLLEPDEAPFITLLSKVRKESAKDVAFSWFEDVSIGKWTQINNAGAPYTDATTELVVDDADIFKIADLVKCVATGEVLRVTDVDPTGGAAQHIHVTRAFGTTAAHADAVANNAYLVRIGQSMAEGYTVGEQLVTTKAKKDNYIQIFSRPVQLTETADAIATYGGKRRAFERKKVMMDIKRDIEAQFLFGEPKLDATGPKYATGGLKYFMGSTSPALNAAGALHKDDFDGWLRDAMAYGSSTKFLFCSPLILSYINAWAEGYVYADPGSLKTWGVKFTTYTSPFGQINFILNRNFLGPYAGEALLVDIKDVVYRYLEGLDLTMKTDLQPKNAHYLLDEIAGHIGMELHNPLDQARIYGVS